MQQSFQTAWIYFMPSEEELCGVLYQRGQISVWLKK
uniref:Uncharacterized protein n=1 Tax=Neisseria meningitidis alpha275 TaxID=295996 RepID=C6SK81_NEIME|nr:hypothetical protein predicted by Glimmer/Critica [Neisseria meningitidis alpha275]